MGGFLALLQRLVYQSAEGIGGLVNRGMALPGRSAVGLGRRLGAAASAARGFSVRPFLSSVGQKLQSGVYHASEGIGNPGRTLGSLRHGLSQRGFVSSPREYFQNLGAAGRNFRSSIGDLFQARRQERDASGRFLPQQRGLLGRAAAGIGGSVGGPLRRLAGSLFGPGASMPGPSTASQAAPGFAGKVAAGFAKLASPSLGIPKAVSLFHQLVAPAALLGTVALLKKFTFGLSESNRDLAKWNGALAASFARLDIQQMRMNIRTANATSGTGAELNRQLGEVLTEFQPIREDLGRLVNVVGISAAKGLKTAIEVLKVLADNVPAIKEIRDGLNLIEKEMKKGQNNKFPGNQVLEAAVGLPGAPVRRLDDVARAHGAFLRRHRDRPRARRGRA